jgi:SAM-dependent methyltransferase
MTSPLPHKQVEGLSELASLLRCLECRGELRLSTMAARPSNSELGQDGVLACLSCGERYPLVGGTPRMLSRELRSELMEHSPDGSRAHPELVLKRDTARSFAYEWSRFGRSRREWEKNFRDYMRPLGPDFFSGRRILDVGTGSGRHSLEAARLGAEVVAVDLGASIDTARRNLPPSVLTVQADAENLPFEDQSFDFVMSIGVLHHLPDTEGVLRSLVRYVRPDGRLRIYLYWVPERRWHRALLKVVSAVRRLTVRMPHRLLHIACYPLAVGLFVTVVIPYRLMRRRPRLRAIAEALPLKAYAEYPFGVLVNDQFDRLSAPLERRFTREEVVEMLARSGLTEVTVIPNNGWVGEGVRPVDVIGVGAV